MLQSILSLMLAAVQVLAWNAAPVYLCLEADGSACLDRGPVFCDCCQSGESSRAGHACGSACTDHGPQAPASAGRGPSWGEGPCGCQHEQISDAQAAIKAQDRSGFELDHGRLNGSLFGAAMLPFAKSTAAGELLAGTGDGSSPSSALAARAGVVLRL